MPQNTVITILGQKGSGKTTLTQDICMDLPRVIVIDANAEYEKGFKTYWGLQECTEALLRNENQSHFKISLRCDSTEESLKLIGLCYYYENCWIVIDETSLYCSPTYVPQEISRLVRFGRHKELSLIFVSRRPAEIPRDITANSDIVFAFRYWEPRDVAYLRSVYPDGDRVTTLSQYHFAVFGQKEVIKNKIPFAALQRYMEQGEHHAEDE